VLPILVFAPVIAHAKAMFEEAARRCDMAVWPYPVVKHLRGEIDEPTLMAAGSEGDRMTEVRGFLGLKALQEGKNDVARAHFRWVMENGNASYTQYAISLIELDRLEKKWIRGMKTLGQGLCEGLFRGNFSWRVDVEIDILHVHERTRVVDQP
jgi:hypothetical protein